MVKNLPANAENAGDATLIHGSGRSPGEVNVNPFQYSCLEKPMDRGAWWATGYGVINLPGRPLLPTEEPGHLSFLDSRLDRPWWGQGNWGRQGLRFGVTLLSFFIQVCFYEEGWQSESCLGMNCCQSLWRRKMITRVGPSLEWQITRRYLHFIITENLVKHFHFSISS